MRNQISVILLGLWLVAGAATIHVPAEHATIQNGIDAAQDGDVVLVADDVYYENINFNGKAITVASHFFMDGDTSHIHNTIIDGSTSNDPNRGSVVFFISGEDTTSVLVGFTITNGTGSELEAERRGGGGIFAYLAYPTICHNRIINNAVHNLANETVAGGGIYAEPFSRKKIIIRDNLIANNTVTSSLYGNALGGGIIVATDAIIENNVITGNKLFYTGTYSSRVCFGGGLSMSHPKPFTFVLVRNNTISNNKIVSTTRGYGAGVDCIYSNCDFSNNTVCDNYIDARNAAYGAGIRVLDCDSTSIVQNNIFSGNSNKVGQLGAGAGLLAVNTDSLTVQHNTFTDNRSTLGGGLYVSNSLNARICGNTFLRNKVDLYGGGIYAKKSNPLIANNILSENMAEAGAGISIANAIGSLGTSLTASGVQDTPSQFRHNEQELFFDGETSLSKHGSIQSGDVPLAQISNNTIVGNVSPSDGGGISCYYSDVLIFNCILWGNSDNNANELGSWNKTVVVAHSIIQGGQDNVYITSGGSFLWLAENLHYDPLFVPGTFFLTDASAGIGTGAQHIECAGQTYFALECDINGDTRPHPIDCFVDMGACESNFKRFTTTEDIHEFFPGSLILQQNYPNPFNASTTLNYSLPGASFVSLKVYDVLGREICSLVNNEQQPGQHSVVFDASDLPSAIYYYKLEGDGFSEMRKMLLVR